MKNLFLLFTALLVLSAFSQPAPSANTDCPTSQYEFNYFYPAGAIRFLDKSIAGAAPIVSWAWDFGDGKTSTVQNPEHYYINENTYTVKLTVTDNNGCEASFSAQIVWQYPQD